MNTKERAARIALLRWTWTLCHPEYVAFCDRDGAMPFDDVLAWAVDDLLKWLPFDVFDAACVDVATRGFDGSLVCAINESAMKNATDDTRARKAVHDAACRAAMDEANAQAAIQRAKEGAS